MPDLLIGRFVLDKVCYPDISNTLKEKDPYKTIDKFQVFSCYGVLNEWGK